MAEYKYDEEGGQFLTFVLTFLLMLLVPLTYSLFPSSSPHRSKASWFDAPGQKVAAIKRANRRSLANPQISKRFLVVVAGWSIVAFLFQKILNTAANSSHAIYDPFQILGIATTATEKEIKKHYKRLSVKFHPDKLVLAENQTKEEVESHYIELTKAYKALTDETIRKNFELYGHPDGRQEMSMGIALPRWVVESHNNIYVLGIYGLIFGVGLPYLVARWWYGSRSKTKDGIINSTAQTYFQHLRDDTPVPRILALLAVSDEFDDARLNRRGKDADEEALNQLDKDVRARLDQLVPEWGLIDSFRTPSIRKALILLYAHVLRVDTPNARLTKAKYQYAHRAVALLNGLMSISLAHNWLDETLVIMGLIQRFVQAVPMIEGPEVELAQLPGVSVETAQQLIKANPLASLGIQGLWKMAEGERKRIITAGGASPQEYDEAVKVMREWPRLEFVDAYFQVTGEKLATPGSIVQFVVEVRTLPLGKDGSLLRDGVRMDAKRTDEETSVRPGSEDDDDTQLDALIGRKDDKSNKEGKTPAGFVRAPFFLEERKPSWWVLLGDHKLDRVIVQPTKVSDVGSERVRTYKVQFQAPPQAGLYTFQAVLRSDSYLGCDAARSVKLKVDDPSALEEAEVEDEISDPEEDSLAGQMAVMRGQRVKPARVKSEESEEESEEESGEEESDGESDSDSDSDSEDSE
ncbi:secretory subunit [Thecaphora frezii]